MTDERQEQFKKDMEAAGFTVEEYEGRDFYSGYAVDVDDYSQIQDVIRATSVRVQHDNLGKGYIVYPA